ncbi:MAG: PAS domain-containing protein [Bacteroidia bacterium]
MKYFLLTFIGLIPWVSGFAQSRKLTDSLISEARKHMCDDSKMVDFHANRILESKNLYSQMRGLGIKAVSLCCMGHFDSAEVIMNRSVELAKKYGQDSFLFDAYFNLAGIQFYQKDTAQYLHSFEKALQYKYSEDKRIDGQIEYVKGLLTSLTKDSTRKFEYNYRAIKIFKSIADTSELLRSYSQMIGHFLNSNLDSSAHYLGLAKRLIKSKKAGILFHRFYSEYLYKTDSFAKSNRIIHKGLKGFPKDAYSFTASLLLLRSKNYIQLDSFNKAMHFLRESYEYKKDVIQKVNKSRLEDIYFSHALSLIKKTERAKAREVEAYQNKSTSYILFGIIISVLLIFSIFMGVLFYKRNVDYKELINSLDKIVEERTLELKQNTNELTKSKKILELALDANYAGVFTYYIDTDSLFVDENWAKVSDIEIHKINGLNQEKYRAYVHQDDQQKLDDFIQSFEISNFGTLEYRFKDKNNKWQWFRINAVKYLDPNTNENLLIGTRTNITESKALKEQLELVNFSIDHADNGILITEMTTEGPKVSYSNERFQKMSGYSYDELLGKDPKTFRGRETRKNATSVIDKSIESQKSFVIELLNYRKNGDAYWVRINASPLFDKEGQCSHFVSFHTEISEEKKLQREKDLLLARLNLATELTGIGIGEFDHETGYVLYSNELATIHNLDRDLSIIDYESFSSNLNEENKLLTENLLFQKVYRSDDYEIQFQIQDKEGKTKYINRIGSSIYKNKALEKSIFIDQDVTARVRNQKRQEESLVRHQLAAAANSVGIWEYDFKTKNLKWDRLMFELYEVDMNNYKGQINDWSSRLHEEDAQKTIDKYYSAVEQGVRFDATFRILTDYGKVKYIKGNAEVIRDEHGNPLKSIGANWDVTEMLKSERKLKELLFEKESILNSVSEGYILVNKDQNIEYLNRHALITLPTNETTPLGKNILEVIKPYKPEVFKSIIEDAIIERTPFNEEFFFEQNGRWLEMGFYPLLSKSGIAIFFKDITKNKLQIDQIKNQNEVFKKVAWMQSHDLRAPLTNIMGALELLNIEQFGDNPDLQKICLVLKASSQKLDSVVHEMNTKLKFLPKG